MIRVDRDSAYFGRENHVEICEAGLLGGKLFVTPVVCGQ